MKDLIRNGALTFVLDDVRCNEGYVTLVDTDGLVGVLPAHGRFVAAIEGVAVTSEPTLDMAHGYAKAMYWWHCREAES